MKVSIEVEGQSLQPLERREGTTGEEFAKHAGVCLLARIIDLGASRVAVTVEDEVPEVTATTANLSFSRAYSVPVEDFAATVSSSVEAHLLASQKATRLQTEANQRSGISPSRPT